MPRQRRTLIGVRVLEAAEILALDVFNRADGQQIHLSAVQQRLEQLRAHRPRAGADSARRR